MPFFIPKELSYCSLAKSPEEILKSLLDHSMNDLVAFFVAGCKDETWTAGEGGKVMNLLLKWLNQESYFRRIPENMALEAASIIQPHYRVFKPFFDYDIAFIIENEEIPSSSLMFSAFSDVFRDLIRTRGSEKKTKKIDLQEIAKKRFHQFAEFMYTGGIEYLWREEPEEILNFLQDASRWKIDRLEAYASSIYKRYIERTNVLHLLQISHQQGLPFLQQECCEYITRQNYGIEIESLPDRTLSVSLLTYTEMAEDILKQTKPLLSQLSLKGEAAMDEKALPFIKSLSTIQKFELSGTSQIHSDLPNAVPDTVELNLKGCAWLSDELFFQIIGKCPSLMKLFLSGNEQLTYRTWAALSGIYRLGTLDISHCTISDDDLDLIAAGSSNLAEVSLAGCKKITEAGLAKLARQCRQLLFADFSECIGISTAGIIEFAASSKNMHILDVSRCPCINDVSLPKVIAFLPYLESIDITGCPVTYSVIEKLKKQKPHIIKGG